MINWHWGTGSALAQADSEIKKLQDEVERLRAEMRELRADLEGATALVGDRETELKTLADFADKRSNAAADWRERAEQAEAQLREVVEAGARLRRHVELLLPRDLGGAAREQIIKDLRHWVALAAAAQPEEGRRRGHTPLRVEDGTFRAAVEGRPRPAQPEEGE